MHRKPYLVRLEPVKQGNNFMIPQARLPMNLNCFGHAGMNKKYEEAYGKASIAAACLYCLQCYLFQQIYLN